MPKVRKIVPGPNRFRIVQGTNISNKLLATMFFLVTCFSEDNHMDYIKICDIKKPGVSIGRLLCTRSLAFEFDEFNSIIIN